MKRKDRSKRWFALGVCFLYLETGICGGIYAGALGGFDIEIGGEEENFDTKDETGERIEEPVEQPGDVSEEPVEEQPVDASEEPVEEQPVDVSEEPAKAQPVEVPEESPKKQQVKTWEKSVGESAKETSMEATGDVSKKQSVKTSETPSKEQPEKREQSSEGEPKKSKEKKREEKKRKPSSKTDDLSVRKTENPGISGIGGVTAMLGTSMVSLQLKFYNNNDKKINKKEKIERNNNNTITFKCLNQMREEKYPVIEINQTGSKFLTEDISILSLRLNGQEVSWHQEGKLLILDAPAKEKKNRVELIAVQNGWRILRMPVWEF